MMMETVPSGTTLHGRYRIERVLGSGGFGHVYLATDLQKNKQFAIKEYLVTGSNGQAQLQHEARVLSQLHHPNLPAFQEAFIERDHYYVVLSYIEGSDLTDYIRIARQRNEAIPFQQVIIWITSICDAVQFLHDQNPPVIHRDIKPDNIRIMSNGNAVLVDLGNAKATADGARTLFFIRHQGTPGYAPPEQYPGGTGTDVRSDVYALGGTLYFALTSYEPPSVSTRNQSLQQGRNTLPSLREILATNPPEESLEAQAAKQFRLGVSKPSKPAPRHIRHLAQLGKIPPEILEQLNAVLHHAMELKPKDRYQSVSDLSSNLRRILNSLPPINTKPKAQTDQYKTQPNLAHAYEKQQAAKSYKQPPPAPKVNKEKQPTKPVPCPRCNSMIPFHSTVCSTCGYNIQAKNSSPTQNTDSGKTHNNQTSLAPHSAFDINSNYLSESSSHKSAIQTSGKHNSFPSQIEQKSSSNNGAAQIFNSTTKIVVASAIIIIILLIIFFIIINSGHPHTEINPSSLTNKYFYLEGWYLEHA